MKKENEKISFNFRLQVLVLVITELQILACSFSSICISPNKLNYISCHLETGIKSYSVKQLLDKI